MPGMRNNRAVRLSTFVDGGSVWDDQNHDKIVNNKVTSSYKSTMREEFRYSAGAALTWLSPMGPLKFSYAYPLNKKKSDKLQRFQFQLGTTF
jgi:outer membrane protein insertion porin family